MPKASYTLAQGLIHSSEEELDAEGSLAHGLRSLASEIHQRMKEEFEEAPLSAGALVAYGLMH
jgi:hypothetical protein